MAKGSGTGVLREMKIVKIIKRELPTDVTRPEYSRMASMLQEDLRKVWLEGSWSSDDGHG